MCVAVWLFLMNPEWWLSRDHKHAERSMGDSVSSYRPALLVGQTANLCLDCMSRPSVVHMLLCPTLVGSADEIVAVAPFRRAVSSIPRPRAFILLLL